MLVLILDNGDGSRSNLEVSEDSGQIVLDVDLDDFGGAAETATMAGTEELAIEADADGSNVRFQAT